MSNQNMDQFHQNVSIHFVNFPPSPYHTQVILSTQYSKAIENSPNLSQDLETQISSIPNFPKLTHNSLLLSLPNLAQDSTLSNTPNSTISIQNSNQYCKASDDPNLSQTHRFDDSFKLSFLESLTLDFPSIIRKFLTEFRLLPQCSSEMRKSISNRVIQRSCVKDLIEIIRKYSSSLCSYLNENYCISLLSQTYHEHFFLVPNQKIPRIHKFIHILLKVSTCIGTHQQLIFLQNSMTNLLSKL
jgi:hypothetical protein